MQEIFNNIVPADTSGTELATLLNAFRDTYASGASGATRPANILAGGYWVDTSDPDELVYKWFVAPGTDVTIFTYNIPGSALTIAGLPLDVLRGDGSVPMTADFDLVGHTLINIPNLDIHTGPTDPAAALSVTNGASDTPSFGVSAGGGTVQSSLNITGTTPASVVSQVHAVSGAGISLDHGAGVETYLQKVDDVFSIGPLQGVNDAFQVNDDGKAQTYQTITDPNDIVNKDYVDDAIAAASPTTANLIGMEGTSAAPVVITAAGGISFSGNKPFNNKFVKGSSGGATITATPQIAAGVDIGQRLLLLGRSDADYLRLTDGNGVSLMEGNGELYLYSNTRAEFMWNGTVWEQI